MIVVRTKGHVVADRKGDDSDTRPEIYQAAKDSPPPALRHPLAELGDGQTPIGYARAVLEHLGRLTTYRGHPWLDGAYATPRAILLAANGVLKEHGLPQIGKRAEWLV